MNAWKKGGGSRGGCWTSRRGCGKVGGRPGPTRREGRADPVNELAETVVAAEVPFDAARLDRLMDEAGIDVLLATSKHNNRYLLGGYSFLFFSAMEAIGHSRYLPVVVYAKGRPERAAYVGNSMEKYDHAVQPFWTPTLQAKAWTTTDAAALAAEHLKKIGAGSARIGIEPAFLPADARAVLGERLPGARLRRCDRGAGAAAGGQDAGGARQAARGVGADHRGDAGDDRLGARGHHQGRDHRAAAAGGGRARAAFRLLPADARGEPQPGAVGAGLGEGRGAVDRFGRQPRRLYRRSGADGGAGGAGRGA